MGRVLVVDDMTGVRRSISVILSGLGHEVQEAENGVKALSILREQPDVDMVITDVLMPEMDGMSLLTHIAALSHKAKVLVISGGGNRLDIDTLMIQAEKHNCKTLRKPFQREDLIRAVEDLI